MFNAAVGPEGNVELTYNQTNYPGFFEVNYGPDASKVNGSLEIIGMSDCFPPLSNDSIVYRSSVSLRSYLKNPANAGLLKTSTSLFRDPLKQLIGDLGQIAIKCKTKNIELDTSLDRIFVFGNDSPRIKAIACVCVIGSDDNSWSTKLLQLYDNIRLAIGVAKPYDNFLDFLTEFRNSPNLRLTQDVFQSHTFFWTTCTKVRLMNRIDDMVDTCHKTFSKFVVQGDVAELLTWRQQVSRDLEIGGKLFQSYEPRTGSGDDDEIDLMLKYFRSNITHFKKQLLGCTKFTDVLDLVEYYDEKFPKIMAAIYKGIKAMTKATHYPFDLDRQA